jgi:hypothetical protein
LVGRFKMLLETVRQPVTYYRCYYMCDDPLCSPTGSEWVDEGLSPRVRAVRR